MAEGEIDKGDEMITGGQAEWHRHNIIQRKAEKFNQVKTKLHHAEIQLLLVESSNY